MAASGDNPFAQEPVAAAYDAWFETPLGALVGRLELALLLRLAQPTAGERALDVGTGTGYLACALAERGLRVTALDSSEVMLAQARAKTDAVKWQLGQAESLPYPDGSFDLVTTVTALEFMSDREAAIKEMLRVLVPGGRLLVGTLNAESAFGRAYVAGAREADTPFRHARLMTAPELLAALCVFGSIRWSSSVFFGPDGRGARLAGLLERVGPLLARSRGALLVARVTK